MKHLPPFRVVFVCNFNQCRSVAAEYFLRKLLLEKDKKLFNRVEITSAGIVFKKILRLLEQKGIPEPQFGKNCSQQVIEIASGHGIDISNHTSKPFSEDLAEGADLIVTMEEFQKREILSRYSQADGRVFTFREFFGISGSTIIEDSFTLPEYDPDTDHYAFPYEFDEQTIDAVERCLRRGLKKFCRWFKE